MRQPFWRCLGDRPAAIGGRLTIGPAALCRYGAGTVLGLILTAGPAAAGDLAAVYQATWAGMPAAHIRFIQHDAGGGYRNQIVIAGEGLPRLFTNFGGSAVSEGRLAAGNAPAPAHYDADFDLRKSRNRKLRMVFSARGGAVIAERGPDDTSHKKILAEEFRRNTIDPLSAVTAIQAGVRRGETGFTVPVYDGERRFDSIVRVLPRDPKRPGIHLAITLKAIAGFKGGNREDVDPDDAPRPVSLSLSDDGRLTPLSMSVPIWFLPLDVTLVRVCAVGDPCKW